MMNDENRVSILICKDAGSASRTLLCRDDLRLRWALTSAEAQAVIQNTKCIVCVTRASLAKQVAATALLEDREIATIVLLDREQWGQWREYFEAGATAVLQASESEQLLDAMADVTGIAFRAAPRVSFKTEVRIPGKPGAWTSLNLSATGMSLIAFPSELGAEIDLAFAIENTTYRCKAIVSRIAQTKARGVVGVAFSDPSPALRAKIDDVIERAQGGTQTVTEPDCDFDPLDDGTILALRSASVGSDALALIRALTTGGKIASVEAAEKWLVAACEAFSAVEVAAMHDPRSAPSWVHDAVLARLRAYRARDRAGPEPPSEADVREVFGLCQRLADSAAAASDAELVQVTNIRAEILRALYDPELLYQA